MSSADANPAPSKKPRRTGICARINCLEETPYYAHQGPYKAGRDIPPSNVTDRTRFSDNGSKRKEQGPTEGHDTSPHHGTLSTPVAIANEASSTQPPTLHHAVSDLPSSVAGPSMPSASHNPPPPAAPQTPPTVNPAVSDLPSSVAGPSMPSASHNPPPPAAPQTPPTVSPAVSDLHSSVAGAPPSTHELSKLRPQKATEFLPSHPQFGTHRIQTRRTPVVPILSGPTIPRDLLPR
ncbi:hypothetical protein B9479_007741, partial [Cryptococcus floricola]